MSRMNFKAPRLIAVLSLLVLAAVPVILVTSCSKGSIDETARGSAPIASLTQAANCVVDSDEDVVVGSGTSARPGCADVVLEPSPSITVFGAIDVETGGTLEIKGSKSATGTPVPIEERQICVDGGTVKEYSQSGTSTDPINLEFVGNRNYIPSGKINKCEEAVSKGGDGFRKGIDVLAGTLILKGAKGVPEYDANGNNIGGVSWTTLAAPAGSQVPGAKAKSLGDKTLYLSADVTQGPEGWQKGDWIVVATTDYDPFHSEFVQIAAPPQSGSNGVAGAKSWVTIKQPLVYYHFGSLPPSSNAVSSSCPNPFYAPNAPTPITAQYQPAFLCDGATQNYGVDERAEVGLISRDVTLTAKTEKPPATPPASPTSSVYWGGEIKIHAGFTKVVIQGVRLSKFGKDKLGSYPIHFHQVGPIGTLPDGTKQTAIIDADSVDHSYNKCVTIHATANLTISNLVCARIVGHIFYEELNDQTEKNEALDNNIVFEHDLGIGSTSNDFDIYGGKDAYGNELDRQQMINKYWWTGDYMTNDQCSNYGTCINYDAFNIPDTDNWKQSVTGFCFTIGTVPPPGNAGYFLAAGLPNKGATEPCPPPSPLPNPPPPKQYYVEPASGFWIQNPGTELIDDAIAGCQGDGVAFWWVSPKVPAIGPDGKSVSLKDHLLGKIKDDRASACLEGFWGSGEIGSVQSEQLFPHVGNSDQNANVIAHFNDITATHIRDRAVWLRPTWFSIKDGHFADDNRAVVLVSSGGIEGNAPGVWELLKDSVLVGESQDNVGRWGPCPTKQSVNLGGITRPGWNYGCISYPAPPVGVAPHSGEIFDYGYPSPVRNAFGYMIYDGPVRIFHDRFVNYNTNLNWSASLSCSKGAFYKQLDTADCSALKYFESVRTTPRNEGPPAPYEGDAALGWFDSNQNAYPTATISKQLMWENTNFRHQIYTEHVALDKFNDGDKNTAIVDGDGTLDGFGVMNAPNGGTALVHPISLNNLPFNSTSNAVEECFSGGAQNEKYEGRQTSLMSPVAMGQLEFVDLFPYQLEATGDPRYTNPPGQSGSHWQTMTFTRTDEVNNGKGGKFRPDMVLHTGRDGQGQWEPKLANRYGYYVMASPSDNPSGRNTHKAGFWHWMDVGMVDVEDPNISPQHPYYVRIGIDYKSTTQDGKTIQAPPPSTSYFTILRGYKSYLGGGVFAAPTFGNGDPNDMFKYWTQWAPGCSGLDEHNRGNVPWKDNNYQAGCPGYDANHPEIKLTAAPSAASLMKADGTPVLNKYYYNPTTGYLWLNLVQQDPNPIGPSPVGSCDSADDGGQSDPTCPHWQKKYAPNRETYYVCPKAGCPIYTISVKSDSNYTYVPGPSTGRPAAASLMAPPPQSSQNQLVVYGTKTVITRQIHVDTTPQKVPYYTATNAPVCATTRPPQP